MLVVHSEHVEEVAAICGSAGGSFGEDVRTAPSTAPFAAVRRCDALTSGSAVKQAKIEQTKRQEETAMPTVFHTRRSSDEDQLRMRYLALTIAAAGVILALAIVVSVGARVW